MGINSELDIIAGNGWTIPDLVWECLDEAEKNFVVLEFSGFKSIEYYRRRLMALGFVGGERFLDAGCGMGQWSIAAAGLNRHVEGVDINSSRLLIATQIAKEQGIENIHFRNGSLESLPFEDNVFDFVFCYGVFMFANMPGALSEFYRVMKPKGRVYINANSLGWYLHMLIDRGIKGGDRGAVKASLRYAIRSLLNRKANKIVTRRWLSRLLQMQGMSIKHMGSEGSIDISQERSSVPPAYKDRYYGLEGIIELTAEKSN